MNDESKTMDLAVLAEEWAKRLKSCEYAGEVVVPEAELPVIAKDVRRELFSPRMTAAYRKCLLILAVNCMYYKHDEEGFWIHFCNLLNITDNQQSQKWLGEKLEVELLALGLLPHSRPGPFRFVSPLREQCGITRHEIPRFAFLLNHLTKRYGWDGIRGLDREEFNQNITGCVQGRYLSQFLFDDPGWSFTRDVARSVSQFQRKVLDLQDLEQLHGYRTGFFRELFGALEQPPGETREHVTRPPLPRLVFLHDFRQVAFVFEQQCTNAGQYKLSGEIVCRNLIPLESQNMFDLTIDGERLNSDGKWETWSIDGWVPSRSPVALFHMERGYVDYRNGVVPGRYYMLAPFEKSPPNEVQLNSYGMIDLPFAELEYDAWLVLIEATTNLEFLGIQRPFDRITNLISWAEETNRLPGTYDLEKAFIGRLPPIALLRCDLFSSNAVGLFVDDGREVRRVKLVDFSGDEVHIDLPVNSRGRIWAEPISRMREFAGLDTLGELSFCLLPECRIKWPDRLYRLEDQPEVILVANDNDISLELENAQPIDKSKREWRILPGVGLVEGYLKSGNYDVPLAHRVFRADIHKKGEARTPFLFSSDFKSPISLIVSGIPRIRAEIGLTDGREIKRLGEFGIFNDAGEVSFSTFAILDALAGYRVPVGQFVVMVASLEIRTDTLFVNCDALYEWITNPTSTLDVQWWPLLPSPIAEMFKRILQMREAPLKQVIMPANEETIPVSLISTFESIRRLCFVFDGAEFPDRPDATVGQIISECQAENPEQGKMLAWFVRAKQVFDAVQRIDETDAGALLLKHSAFLWQPPFQRWKGKVAEIVRHLKDDVEVLPLAAEWKKDVERGYLASYASRIASQTGGRDLTHAWVTYRAGNLDAAVTKARSLFDGSVSSPITDLAAILVRLCWFRLGYFKSQPEMDFRSSNKKLQAAYAELLNIIGFADWTNKRPVPATQNLNRLAATLPITSQDRSLLKLFAEAERDLQLSSERDWLGCYCELLLARAMNMDGKATQIAKLFQGVLKNVPASPDRNLLIEITEKYL
jgi:hypothetical protein